MMRHLAKIAALIGLLFATNALTLNLASPSVSPVTSMPVTPIPVAPVTASNAAAVSTGSSMSAGSTLLRPDDEPLDLDAFDDMFDDEILRDEDGITLSPEQINELIDIARQIDERLARRLRQACDADPDEFVRLLQKSGRRVIALAQLKERDPRLYRLKLSEWHSEAEINRKSMQLAVAIRAEDDARIKSLQEELTQNVRIHAALTLAGRGEYLRRLKEHVERLQNELDRDASNLEETVEQRLSEVVARAEAMAAGDRAARRQHR